MGGIILKLCGMAVLSAFLCLLLKKWNADASVTVRLIAGVMLSAACIGAMSPLMELVSLLGESEAISGYVGILLRVLAVATVTHVTANICRDCGESTIAGYVELGGKIEILILSLPIMKEIIEKAMELLNVGSA